MDARERLRARMSVPAPSALEQVRSFLQTYVADSDGMADISSQVRQTLAVGSGSIRRALVALDGVLAQPVRKGELAHLVAWDANWGLDDDSDEVAAVLLRELADLLRSLLDDA